MCDVPSIAVFCSESIIIIIIIIIVVINFWGGMEIIFISVIIHTRSLKKQNL